MLVLSGQKLLVCLNFIQSMVTILQKTSTMKLREVIKKYIYYWILNLNKNIWLRFVVVCSDCSVIYRYHWKAKGNYLEPYCFDYTIPSKNCHCQLRWEWCTPFYMIRNYFLFFSFLFRVIIVSHISRAKPLVQLKGKWLLNVCCVGICRFICTLHHCAILVVFHQPWPC